MTNNYFFSKRLSSVMCVLSTMTREWFGNGSVYSRLILGSNLSRFSLASLICLCMLTIGSGNAWGATSTVTISDTNYPSKQTGTTVSGTGDLESTWTVTVVANSFNGNNNGKIQAGSNRQSATSITLSSSSFKGKTITSIAVTAYDDANKTRAVFTAKVNGTQFGSTSTLKTSSDTYTASGNVACTGDVVVELKRSSAQNKALYLSKVVVTYTAAEPCTPLGTINWSILGSN